MSRAYDDLTRAARRAFIEGRLEAAAELFERARLAAGDPVEADRAFCNRCAVLVELEAVGSEVSELKRILLRTTDPKTRWMAAYYTALAYDLQGDRDGALNFSSRALSLAEALGEAETEAATANLLGNLALAASRFEEAEAAYEKALDRYRLLEEEPAVLMRAQVEDNLGYTRICTDRLAEGIALCERSRDTMRRLGANHYLPQPLQDLCYGYLLDGRLDAARTHGEEGLELAFDIDDRLIVKNLLFLLAEVAVREGDRFRAKRFLGELARWYPEIGPSEEIVDLFLSMDLTRVVNLRG